jgi:pimeloyl-ACP methyl ester carboxylesterase
MQHEFSTMQHNRNSSPDLAIDDRGGAGMPVLFAHGVGSAGRTWSELFARLAPYRLVASDMRGHGRSSTPAGPYVLADLVADQVRVIDSLGFDRVHFVGFSIGALIGQGLALAHPDRVASLTLLSGIAGRSPDEAARSLDRLATIRTSDPADVARTSVPRWFTADFARGRPDLVAAEVALVSAVDPAGYAACYEVLATTDLADHLGHIEAPTLVMTGQDDAGSTPRMSELMAQRIPRSRLSIIPRMRHYIHIEGSAAVAEALTDFLGSVAT